MDNNERDRKLDQWLDEALSQYSAAEPRLGLEQRVLANVRAEQQARTGRRSFWRWMPAFAAIAAVLIVMVAVRPYWEQNVAKAPTNSLPAQAKDSAEIETYRRTDSQSSTVILEKKKVPAGTPALPTRREVRAGHGASDAYENVAKEKAEPALSNQATSKAGQPATVMNGYLANAPAKETDKDKVLLDARRDLGTHGNLQSVVVAAPAPAPAKGASAGVVGGTVSTGVLAQQPRAKSVPDNTLEVTPQSDSVEVEVSDLAAEKIPTEKIAAMPQVSPKQMRAMKGRAKGPLAKKLEENVDTVNIVGVGVLRTNLKTIPPGPTQQFPSPTPLSEQEKLMMAAAKQMKSKAANEQKQDVTDGDTRPIEIKKIEIAPLPGPQK